ncbi:MDR family MFS transporter [Streptomyces jeddahensis]|uniref:Multidrug resistance protein MdtH n=1 Tax=Streptomyces jeddahensis TaxID=1716141 RepID=A0A177HPF2_9ACTN|nr:MFS transporter [Streptomyces jeddahensis]OAH12881.1 multidrug resistance protein MdtH [Streptomyces jeddahensis]
MTDTTTASPPVLARVLIVGNGIMSLANSVTVPFLAVFLHRELGLQPGMIGFVIGSSVFFSIFAGFVGGSLSDLLGRTRLLLISLLGVIGSFVGLYFSHGVLAVFVFNATMALSSSSFGPVGKALLSDLLPPGRRVKWFSYQYVTTNMGYAVGPVVGAAVGLAGDRSAFLVGALGYGVYLLGLAGVLLLTSSSSASAGEPGRTATGEGQTQLFGSVLKGLAESARVVATDSRLLFLILAGLLLEAVHGRVSSLLAQHLSGGFADGTAILGYVLTINAVTVVVLQLSVSKFMDKRNPVASIVVGGLLTVLGMAGFAFAEELWHFVAAMVVFSLGEILIYPAEFAIIDRIAPEDRRGSYFGAQTFAQLGVFIGPYTGGLLLAAYGGTTMFLGVGSFALASVVIYLLVGRRIPGLAGPVAERSAERPKEEHADDVA